MKKIIFNDRYGLTQAVLDGRKTMTRRVCKHNRPNGTYEIVFPVFGPNDFDNEGNNISPINYAFGWKDCNGNFIGWNIPQYKVGEVVAIAMSYKKIVEYLGKKLVDVGKWMDDNHITKNMAGWLNKMLVIADLMIFHIRITDVKIERLQDISDDDCIKEGIGKWTVRGKRNYGVFDYMKDKFLYYHTPREAFASLIDKVSGKGVWESNPFVFVYEFELVD